MIRFVCVLATARDDCDVHRENARRVSDVPFASPRVPRVGAHVFVSPALAPREQQEPERGGEHEEQQRGSEGQKDLYQLYSSRPQNESTKSSKMDLDANRAERSKA